MRRDGRSGGAADGLGTPARPGADGPLGREVRAHAEDFDIHVRYDPRNREVHAHAEDFPGRGGESAPDRPARDYSRGAASDTRGVLPARGPTMGGAVRPGEPPACARPREEAPLRRDRLDAERPLARDRVREGESPARLSARLGVPVCALLRANRLTCTAWLTPGREISVPGPGFCAADPFPCPARLVDLPARARPAEAFVAAEGDTLASVARALGTSERLILLALGRAEGPLRAGERFLLEPGQHGARVHTVLPGETLAALGADPAETARRNRLADERVYPGMRLVLPREAKGK